MKNSDKSSENLTAVVGIALTILAIFLFVWFMRSLPTPAQDNKPTAEESAQYEEYKSEQQLNANGEQEACRDQMARDVERYGEQVIDTYDCTK
mgnify:CR=1 FL=1